MPPSQANDASVTSFWGAPSRTQSHSAGATSTTICWETRRCPGNPDKRQTQIPPDILSLTDLRAP